MIEVDYALSEEAINTDAKRLSEEKADELQKVADRIADWIGREIARSLVTRMRAGR